MDWIDVGERDEAIEAAEEEFILSQNISSTESTYITAVLSRENAIAHAAIEFQNSRNPTMLKWDEKEFHEKVLHPEATRREKRSPSEIAAEHAAQDAMTRSILGGV